MIPAHGKRQTASVLTEALLFVGARVAGVDGGEAIRAARLVLPEIDGEELGYLRSTLNNDGFPLQLCVTASQSRRTVRVLGDPTRPVDEPDPTHGSQRFDGAHTALWRLLDGCGCGLLRPACDCLLQTLRSADAASTVLMTGPLWLGTGIGCRGAAVYVNARRGLLEERWARVAECVRATTCADEAMRMMAAVMPHTLPASVGIEGITKDDARVKVYWRLRHATSLKNLGCALFVEPSLVQFLDRMLGRRQVGMSGLVFGAGFRVADGHLQDVKIDICGHCIPLSPEEWLSAIETISAWNGLVDMGLGPALRSRVVEVALLGFGVDAFRRPRLNLYLKPSSP